MSLTDASRRPATFPHQTFMGADVLSAPVDRPGTSCLAVLAYRRRAVGQRPEATNYAGLLLPALPKYDPTPLHPLGER